MKNLIASLFAALMLCPTAHAQQAPDLTLTGLVEGKDHQTYRYLPFDVPAGVHRITVQFDYDKAADKTTIDLGLRDPSGFRGWSGGNKSEFTVSDLDATTSYLPGPITPGQWKLVLGIPNARPTAHTAFTARIYFSKDGSAPAVLDKPMQEGPAWYRGDLHMHTSHSDGSCASQSGKRQVPCPLYFTAAAAASRKLDFIVLSEHNTTSQQQAIRELQPYFDQLLMIPGIELTSFTGHANFVGSSLPLDFRVGSAEVPDWNALLKQLPAAGFFSINHPVRPSGEICMGCGWTATPAIDMDRVNGMEVVNGVDADTPYSGLPAWQSELDRGHRITAVGGSDDHNATNALTTKEYGHIGMPTTVVHAQNLSQRAILAGLRAGHVFIDVQGAASGQQRLLEFTVRAGDAQAMMGDALRAPKDGALTLRIRVVSLAGGTARILVDGKPLQDALSIAGKDESQTLSWGADGHRHTLRVEVRDAAGRLALVGNPIYILGE
ncbi:CehA/McbA family metallohydrolase [Burkholderiaceae bacterium UC74_6]